MRYVRAFMFSLMMTMIMCSAVSYAASSADSNARAVAPGAPVADRPAAIQTDRGTPVMVEHEGTDSLGSKFAFQLKDEFNASTLFVLTEKDAPKLKVFISTTAEFPSRPHIASAYSIVWAFSQADGTLSFLLAREVGLVTAEELDALVAKTAQRTDGFAAKYTYLFTRKN